MLKKPTRKKLEADSEENHHFNSKNKNMSCVEDSKSVEAP